MTAALVVFGCALLTVPVDERIGRAFDRAAAWAIAAVLRVLLWLLDRC